MKLSLKELKRMTEVIPPWEWPNDVGPALLETLRDPGVREEELLLAVDLAGDTVVVDDDIVGALLSIVRNGEASEEVRGRAAIALGPVLELASDEILSSDPDHFDDPSMVPITESTFREIQRGLRALYLDASVPKQVRRRILEASVRASEDWHQDALRAAYASDDEEWKLTAVFGMRFVGGFDEQILASLTSKSPDILREALLAAGNWSLDGAWERAVELVKAKDVEKEILLAAISAVGGIRPAETGEVLEHLEDSDDPEISEAAAEAMSMPGEDWDDELGEDEDEEDDEDEDEDEDEGDPGLPN